MDETYEARVVVADPHPAMLVHARRILNGTDDIEVVATAGDLAWATRIAAEQEADVLVVDLSMLSGATRGKIAQLREQLPDTAIVVLTMEASPAYAPALIGAGASAYVLKEFAEDDLAHAVRQATIGQRFVTAKVAA